MTTWPLTPTAGLVSLVQQLRLLSDISYVSCYIILHIIKTCSIWLPLDSTTKQLRRPPPLALGKHGSSPQSLRHHLQPLAGQTRPIRRPVCFSFIRTPFFTIQKPKLRKSNEIHISNFIFLRNKALHTINKIKSENTEKRKWECI